MDGLRAGSVVVVGTGEIAKREGCVANFGKKTIVMTLLKDQIAKVCAIQSIENVCTVRSGNDRQTTTILF